MSLLQEYVPATKKARVPAKASPARAKAHKPPKQPKKKQQPRTKSPPAVKAKAKQQQPAARGQKGKQQPASMYSNAYEPSTDNERPKKHGGTRGRGRSPKPNGIRRKASAMERRQIAPTAAATDAGRGKQKAAAVATDAGKGRQGGAAAGGTRRARDAGEQEGSRRVRSRRDGEVRHCSCISAWGYEPAAFCQLHFSAGWSNWTLGKIIDTCAGCTHTSALAPLR